MQAFVPKHGWKEWKTLENDQKVPYYRIKSFKKLEKNARHGHIASQEFVVKLFLNKNESKV